MSAARGVTALSEAVAALRASKVTAGSAAAAAEAGRPRLSGLQLQVLALYREFLRVARTKAPEQRKAFEGHVRDEFKRNAEAIARTDTNTVEWYIRRGKRQLATLKMSQVHTINYFVAQKNSSS